MAELFSWVPLPYCSTPRCPFPIKPLALSAHVSPRTIHFWVLDKSPVSGPGRGPPSSVQFSCWVVSDSLWPHGPQHARPPCPLPTPIAYSNSCPLSQRYQLTILFSVIPFSSCPQSFPASESFPVSQLFASGGQSIGVSTSKSVPPNEHPGLISFRMDWLDLLAVQGTLKSLLQHDSSKRINYSVLGFLYSPTLTSIHDYWKKP